jgi:putative ABC transport system ATP-binding protein
VLELRDLAKRYQVGAGDPIIALDGVSLRIAAGEFVAIIGPSGSGKTTLLELIAGTKRPDSGKVLVEGRDLAEMSSKEADAYRRWDLGIVDQPDALFPGARVLRNASLKLWMTNRRNAEATVEPLLRRLGLGDRLRHRIEQLSMGERQRVAIARALAITPKIVLADEPTGSLDSKRSGDVLELLRELCSERGVMMVLATHDAQAAGFADKVLELRDGQLRPAETQASR